MLFVTEYTQSHCMVQHIMGLFRYWTFLQYHQKSRKALKDLEGPMLHPFSLPANDRYFPFNIRYQQDMVFPITFVVVLQLSFVFK